MTSREDLAAWLEATTWAAHDIPEVALPPDPAEFATVPYETAGNAMRWGPDDPELQANPDEVMACWREATTGAASPVAMPAAGTLTFAPDAVTFSVDGREFFTAEARSAEWVADLTRAPAPERWSNTPVFYSYAEWTS
jgi:hypothetical protein